jgi:hypothetical protein
VLVCEVAAALVVGDVVAVAAAVPLVALDALDDEVLSESSDDVEADVDDEVRVLDAAVCVAVVALRPSRHASTPPSDSIDATLSAVAAFRARAARGLRRARPGRRGGGVGVRSSMSTKVRTGRERPIRTG